MGFKVSLSNDISDLVIKASKIAIERALEECGLIGEGYAKQYLTLKRAVDTGRLRNSVTHSRDGSGTVYIGTNVEYAPYIEYGTSKMKARSYLKPCLADHVDQYEKIIKDELSKETI